MKRFIVGLIAIAAMIVPATASATSSVEVCFPKPTSEGVALISPISGACPSLFTLTTLGEEGPAGPTGPEGPKGATGATGPEGPEGKGITKVSWSETLNGESAKETSSTAGPFTLKRICEPNESHTNTRMIIELSSSAPFYEVTEAQTLKPHAEGKLNSFVLESNPSHGYQVDVTNTNSYTFFAFGERSANLCTFEGWIITN